MATITKKQLAEQALRIISGGHPKPDQPIDIREIMLHADQLRDELVLELTMANGGISVDPAFVSYYENVAVSLDVNKNIRYSVLPANPIRLPLNIGVYSISPMNNMNDQYIPIPPSGSWLYKDTMAMETNLIVKYFTVNRNVYYVNIDPVITSVLMGIVASSKDITESAPYPLTPEAEANILRKLVQMFGMQKQTPHDETENGQKNA